ncbi:Flagellar protein FliL [Petrocella atlantisensis]|uniref:Flagellar protein FliL n=1 Tax=Petrocella atlantisensis TaxID=2173034 RepID=A0A3P7P7X5_9FIRM|nr:flagellar basal body-associated FliL family protein [Petrocella atlantisensis]VDN46313.1 Flagellar protein FliL [Petrocella atlantisensis]
MAKKKQPELDEDGVEKVAKKPQDKSKIVMMIGVVLIIVSLIFSMISLITIMGISKALRGEEEAAELEENGPPQISVNDIEPFIFSEKFIFIYNDTGNTDKVHNVVVEIGVGILATEKDAAKVLETMTTRETILRDGIETLMKSKSYEDFASAESTDALKNEILLYLQSRLESESIVDVYFNNLLTSSK